MGWYSLPGQCPFRDFNSKDEACRRAEPGGECASPNGDRTCTYHLEHAGEVTLQELTGSKKCQGEGKDSGWWWGVRNRMMCDARVSKLKRAFRHKYRSLPSDLA